MSDTNKTDLEYFRNKIQEKCKEIDDLYNRALELRVDTWEAKSVSLSECQKNFAIKQVAEWLRVGGSNRSDVDAAHSSLLNRVMSGKKALPKPPPLRMSYPWYELGEGDKIELDPVWDRMVTAQGGKPDKVHFGNSGPFEWHDRNKDILVYPPSGELFQLFTENNKTFIQKFNK